MYKDRVHLKQGQSIRVKSRSGSGQIVGGADRGNWRSSGSRARAVTEERVLRTGLWQTEGEKKISAGHLKGNAGVGQDRRLD